MTRDVLVTISGKRLMGSGDEDIEFVMPGTHLERNGIHMVRYEEPAEGMDGKTENTIVIGGGCMKIRKKGLSNVEMRFLNRAERSMSCYSTPYGDFLIGISTRDISIREESDRLRVSVDYAMDIGAEHLSDCAIQLEVRSRSAAAQ